VAQQRRLEVVLREAESSRQRGQAAAQLAELEANRHAHSIAWLEVARDLHGWLTGHNASDTHLPCFAIDSLWSLSSSHIKTSWFMLLILLACRQREAAAALIGAAQAACTRQRRTGARLEQLLFGMPQPSPADGSIPTLIRVVCCSPSLLSRPHSLACLQIATFN